MAYGVCALSMLTSLINDQHEFCQSIFCPSIRRPAELGDVDLSSSAYGCFPGSYLWKTYTRMDGNPVGVSSRHPGHGRHYSETMGLSHLDELLLPRCHVLEVVGYWPGADALSSVEGERRSRLAGLPPPGSKNDVDEQSWMRVESVFRDTVPESAVVIWTPALQNHSRVKMGPTSRECHLKAYHRAC